MGRAFEVRKAAMMKTGLEKTKVYTRYSKEIYLIAKNGGADPEVNLNLKRAIEKAKKAQVPADVIKRAVEKANNSAGEDYKKNMYEGFGGSGSTIIIECLTDNDNRTISEMQTCFKKSDNKLGIGGAVSHGYEHLGIITLKDVEEEAVMENLLENGLDFHDIEMEEDGFVTVYTSFEDFNNVRNFLLKEYDTSKVITDEVTWLSSNTVELAGEDKDKFAKLINMLNECEDVQNIYHNVTNMEDL